MDYESEYKALTDAIGILERAPRPDHISASAFCENVRLHLVARCQNLFDECFREPVTCGLLGPLQPLQPDRFASFGVLGVSPKEWADLNAGIR
jgi:hypothetical protein